ncbi:MAG: PQQ-binding-like beta-propeller repeat protein [Candidatus Brocadiia bacterium]
MTAGHHRPSLATALALAGLVAALGRGAAAADWPQWRGPQGSAVSPESSGWPRGWPPKRLWSRDVGRGCTSPILADGKLYVMGWEGRDRGVEQPGGHDVVACFDARTGRELWTRRYPARYQGRHRRGDTGAYGGPSSTPTLDRATGYLYTLSIDGDLRCWDAAQEGKPVWARNLYDDFTVPQRPHVGGGRRDYGYPTSPLVRGDLLVLEVGAQEGTVMALDKKTGQRRWASQYRKPGGHTGGVVPLRVAGTECLALLALHDLVVLRLDPGHEGETLAASRWQTDFACNVASPAAADGRVVVTSGYNHEEAALFDVAPGGLRQVWRTGAHAVASSPVVHGGRVYLVRGALQCVDLATGKLLWRGGGFGNGNCLVAAGDEKLIVFGARKLALLDAGADDYRELARVDRVVRGTCYPHVALADGILCVKDRDGNLVVFSVRPEPDKQPPEVAAVVAAGDPRKVRVRFSEPVEKSTAERPAGYAIDCGVKVAAARVSPDGHSVVLDVSQLHEGGTYTLTIEGVRDRAAEPNPIQPGTRVRFRYRASPRASEGLVALYTFEEGRGSVVHDACDAASPLDLAASEPGALAWVPGGLAVRGEALIRSAGPATRIIEACRESGEITIEAWIKPASDRQKGPARIVSLSKDPHHRNFTLGQEGRAYDVRLRTTATGANGAEPSTRSRACVAPRLAHVAYTRDRAAKARIYLDGEVVGEETIRGHLGNWDPAYRLALANELSGERAWRGELHLVAVYSRALAPDEVKACAAAGPGGERPE